MSGNSDNTPFTEEFGNAVFKNAFELWFLPEIEARVGDGRLVEPFQLTAVQAIFPPASRVIIRINEEVRGLALARAVGEVQPGQAVTTRDISGFEAFELDDADLDAGHFTALRHDANWVVTFNFLRLRATTTQTLDLADQFLRTSELALESGLANAAADNLFSACELVAKSRLTIHSLPTGKSHGLVHSGINKWRKLGNVDADFVDLFNKLSALRPRARYASTLLTEAPSDDDIRVVEREIAALKARVAPKVLRPGNSQ